MTGLLGPRVALMAAALHPFQVVLTPYKPEAKDKCLTSQEYYDRKAEMCCARCPPGERQLLGLWRGVLWRGGACPGRRALESRWAAPRDMHSRAHDGPGLSHVLSPPASTLLGDFSSLMSTYVLTLSPCPGRLLDTALMS